MYIFDTWFLTLYIWHRYLTCYYLTPDTWDLISDTDTWHVITWHLTIDILSLDTWHMLSPGNDTFDLILWHLTGYYYTWHLYYITFSWLSLLRGLWHDYYTATRYLVLLNSWAPVLLNSCIPCIVTLVNSTVILASDRAYLVSGWRGCIPRSC